MDERRPNGPNGKKEGDPNKATDEPTTSRANSPTTTATSSTATAIPTSIAQTQSQPPNSDLSTSTTSTSTSTSALPPDASTSFTTTTTDTTTTTSSTQSSPNNPTTTTTGAPQKAPDTLIMFNVVFVLAPSTPASAATSTSIDPITDPNPTSSVNANISRTKGSTARPGEGAENGEGVGVEEVYEHCARKVARALQYKQKQRGFVWEGVRAVAGVRAQAVEGGLSYTQAWPLLASASSLARALASAYNGLTTSRLAHLTLGPNTTLSLQLPQTNSTSHVPTPTSPGCTATAPLWLTTFRPYPLHGESPHADGTEGGGGTISPHSALLLLIPPETLLKEIASSAPSPLSASLAYLIRNLRPTKTLLQTSRKSRLSLQNLQVLALHLIQWRRARAIAPLHHTNTYIVSPLAEWAGLEAASVAFRARFAALPGLPSMLVRMSAAGPGKGVQAWGRLMPTPDHKDAYMEMLEWLIKGGWVTQLRTFAWVVVSREVKVEVARKAKWEDKEAASATAVDETDEGEGDEIVSRNGSAVVKSRRHSSQGSASVWSPRLKPHQVLSARRTSDTGSFTSVSTALRMPLRPRLEPLAVTHAKHGRTHRLSDVSVTSKVLLDEKPLDASDPDIDTPEFEASVVLSPHKANALESKWLEHIGACLPDADVRELWPRLLKYFDGKHAVEEIAMQEGLKRKALSPMLAKLTSEGGVLRVVRHW